MWHWDGLLDVADETFGDRLGLGHVSVPNDHDELIAAQPIDEVERPDCAHEALRDNLKYKVADPVAVSVIDGLEAVKVKQDQRPGALIIKRFVGDVETLPSVQQIRERIVVGESSMRTDPFPVAEQHAEQTARCVEQPDLVGRERPLIAVLQADQSRRAVVGRDSR